MGLKSKIDYVKTFKFSLILAGLFLSGSLVAQRMATLEVTITKDKAGLHIPMQVPLHELSFLPDSLLQFVELIGKSSIPVAYQIDHRGSGTLHWMMEPSAQGKKIYELRKGQPSAQQVGPKTVINDGKLTIGSLGKNLLQYNFKTIYPAAGIDTVYKRSGFIHPLWSPRGQELTRSQPADHYHHFGLWNAWTQVHYQGETYDLWNLVQKQGTVRAVRLHSITEGPVYAEYKTLLEHVIFQKNGKEQVVLNEVQTVRVYPPANGRNYYNLDLTMEMNGATEHPVQLLRYRYGGLGVRTTGEWDRNNSTVLTSEGKNRRDADSTTARWCMVQGALGTDQGGFVMMSYPANYNHPEPLRVWPENQYDRGDMFVNFSPIKTKNWLLVPAKTYVLQYRFLLFNDVLTKEKAEAAWQHYAYPPTVTIKKENNKQ